jgi:hypothetical protein
MKTPERLSALRNARLTLRKRDRRIAYIKRKLDSLTLERGVAVESDVQLEIQGVIERESLQMESLGNSDFRRIFWEQQVAALKVKGPKGMHWHPLFLRWCLNLSRVSPKAYEIMRESGIKGTP